MYSLTKVVSRSLIVVLFTLAFSELNARQGQVLYDKGIAQLDAEQPDSAGFYFERAASAFQAAGQTEEYIKAQIQLLDVLQATESFEKLEKESQALLTELEGFEQAKPEWLAKVHYHLGNVEELIQGDMNQAKRHYLKGLDFQKKSEQPHLVYPQLMNALGRLMAKFSETNTARNYLEAALKYLQTHYPEDVAFRSEVEAGKSMTLFNDSKPQEALLGVKESLRTLQGAGDKNEVKKALSIHYDFLTDIYTSIDQYDSALLMLEKRLVIENSMAFQSGLSESRMMMQHAIILGYQGQIRQAVEEMRNAIQQYSQLISPDHIRLARCYSFLAQYIVRNSGGIQEAVGYLDRAYNIYLKTFGPYHPGTADMLLVKGTLKYQSGNFTAALELFNQALAIQKRNEATLKITQLTDLVADANIMLRRFEPALKSVEGSIPVYNKMYGPLNKFSGNVHSIRAIALNGLGELDNSMAELQKALDIFEQLNGEKHQKVADLYFKQSLIRTSQKNLPESLKLIQQAIISNSYVFRSDSLDANPNPDDAINGMSMVRYLQRKAQLLSLKAPDEQTLKTIDNTYDAAILMMDQIARGHRNNRDILLLNRVFRGIYDASLNNLFKLYELNPDEDLKEKMLQLAGAAKAKALALNHSHRKAKHYANLPDSMLEKENELLQQIASIQSQLVVTDMDSTRRKDLENRLFEAKREKENFLERLGRDYPDYFRLKYDNGFYDSRSIQQNLKEKEAYLEYHKTRTDLYSFYLTQDRFQLSKVGLPKNFDSLAVRFNSAIKLKEQDAHHENGESLYQYLLARLENLEEVENIIILPDQLLWSLNFDLLPSPKQEAQYLLEQYAISYAYSAKLLFDEKTSLEGNKKVLALSYQDDETGGSISLDNMRNADLIDIPGTASEVAGISQIIEGDYYYGTHAREGLFKEKAKGYSILHLALHGEVDYKSSDNSKLYFARQDADSTEDQVLYPFELYNMNLKANLAVLSACETGAGRISSGEGIMSLGRAFQYAGVQSLLLSQWEVSDPVSPVIMSEFYKNLKSGMDKAQSLRQAKLSFLETADNVAASPYYWGGFFILGNTEPVDLEPSYPLIWIGVIVLLLMLSVVFFMARKRQKSSTA